MWAIEAKIIPVVIPTAPLSTDSTVAIPEINPPTIPRVAPSPSNAIPTTVIIDAAFAI